MSPNFLTNLFNNPNQVINQLMSGNQNSQSIINQANTMTNGKSQNEIKEIVRNLCKERNIDFNEIERMVNERGSSSVK